jgi:quercetin dioxygenase-like cupin family protein
MFEHARVDKEQATLVDRPDFSGVVRRQELHVPADRGGMEILAVFFDAGARTRPHIHEVDQTLHVLDGEGVLATETSLQVIRPGDLLFIPGGVWHWHGATPSTSMCHLSIKGPGDTDWDPPEKNWSEYMEI